MHKAPITKDITHKIISTIHKSTPSKIATGLKNIRHAANGSPDHKSNQNASIKGNMSATSKLQ